MVAHPQWRFYGCSGYPTECRETLEFDEWAAMLGNEAAAQRLLKRRAKVARGRQGKA